jgi:hypothetical protein
MLPAPSEGGSRFGSCEKAAGPRLEGRYEGASVVLPKTKGVHSPRSMALISEFVGTGFQP